MLTLAMLNSSCVTLARVELLKSFSEFKGLAYCAQQCLEWPEVLENSRVRRPTTCGQCRLDDEGSSDASSSERVWRFSTTGSSRRSLLYRHRQSNCELQCTPADFRGFDHEGGSEANEETGAVCLVMASSTTGSLEIAWVHRQRHFVAFERASRRLQHSRLGMPRWLMDHGFACLEERHARGVQLQIRGAGKG